MKISDTLKNRILTHWDTISDEAIARAKSVERLECRYLNIPFAFDNVLTNRARWDSHENRFDMIVISVWDGEEVKQSIIKL